MIRCLLFGHKWKFYTEEREIDYGLVFNSSTNIKIKVFDNLRICERCFKKQKKIKILDIHQGWQVSALNKEEERELKFKKLGI